MMPERQSNIWRYLQTTYISVFNPIDIKISAHDPVVQPGHTLYVAGVFRNPEVFKVFPEQIVTVCHELCSSLEEAGVE
jgi:hypothetical protein